MAGVFDCSICDHTYDENDRKPLVLLCGHTHCQQCLLNVVSRSSPACPSCRKEIVTPVDELLVVFTLIPPTGSGKAASKSEVNKELSCRAHQNELDYWCKQCQISICKRCLVESHADHKLTLIEEMVTDKKLLSDKKDQIAADLQQTKTSIETLQLLESVGSKIDERKSEIIEKKNSLQMKQVILTEWVDVLEKISSEPSQKQVSVVVKILKYQTPALTEASIHGALGEIDNWVSQLQVSTKPDETPDKPFETYIPDGHPWVIISNELAEKALCTMKETDHQTPKATVISTDESPILYLPELLQYLAASSATMELQLMDKAVKAPYEKDWFPLKAGGEKSTDFKHCYRLKTLGNSLVYFQTLAAALTAVNYVINESAENKVIILVYPDTRTYDVCVLAFGEVVKGNTGSWPLPLEVHVIGMDPWQHLEWVECILPSLYYIAQPDMGECRVYLPGCDWYHVFAYKLCPVLAELGKKFSTQHRLYLPPGSIHDDSKPHYRQEAEKHKIALEFRDW